MPGTSARTLPSTVLSLRHHPVTYSTATDINPRPPAPPGNVCPVLMAREKANGANVAFEPLAVSHSKAGLAHGRRSAGVPAARLVARSDLRGRPAEACAQDAGQARRRLHRRARHPGAGLRGTGQAHR